jgi:hypothetical protein
MIEGKTSKRTKRGRPKKQPYKSLFQRLGTESKLEKAADAYNAFLMGDHIVKSNCRELGLSLHHGSQIQLDVMTDPQNDITLPVKLIAEQGHAYGKLTQALVKHRENIQKPSMQRKMQGLGIDLNKALKDMGDVNFKCFAEKITREDLSSRHSTINNALSALVHHYSGKRVSPGNIRKTLRRAQKQLLAEGTSPN